MPRRNSSAAMSEWTRPMVSALQVGAASHFFQKPARADSARALRLPILAQNMTNADFTTTAVGMRGCGLRSETGAITAAERSKILSDHATRRRRTVTVFAPSAASIPAQRLLPTGVAAVDSPRRPAEYAAARPAGHRCGEAPRRGFEPDTGTDGVRLWRNGRWACRTCPTAPTEFREETSGRKPVAQSGNGSPVRRTRGRRG